MRVLPRLLVPLALTVLLPIAGCADVDDWSSPRGSGAASGTLSAGFLPTPAPTPEATFEPAAGTWDDVRAPSGYRVVMLSAGTDDATATLAEAVRSWAAEARASLREIDAAHAPLDAIDEALALHPDVVLSVGNGVVDALTVVSASHLDQQFLVLGAELPEPTENVLSVMWTGAAFRGTDVTASSRYDASSVTAARARTAVAAGTAAVLSGVSGYVISLDGVQTDR